MIFYLYDENFIISLIILLKLYLLNIINFYLIVTVFFFFAQCLNPNQDINHPSLAEKCASNSIAEDGFLCSRILSIKAVLTNLSTLLFS